MLTDVQLRKINPTGKKFRLHDANGLCLVVSPTGTKRWEFRYKYPGKDGKSVEKNISFGSIPEVSLKTARLKTASAREMLRNLVDPAQAREEQKRTIELKARNTFQHVAKEWFDNQKPKWTETHATKLWRRLEMHIFPHLGHRPIAEIDSMELWDTLKKAEASEVVFTAHRLLQVCTLIFRFAIQSRRRNDNPAYDTRGLLRAHKATNYPCISENEVPGFLKAFDEVSIKPITRLAFQLLLLTFVRTGELRRARWIDIDLEKQEWRVPPEFTKMRELHIVPLSDQAIRILREIRVISGGGEYLFPSPAKQKTPFLCENAITGVIERMGYQGKMVGHSVRSLASTILNEEGFSADAIERQLAHMPRDAVRAAYNRAQYLPLRKAMMQWWADRLQTLGMRIPSTESV